MKVIKNINNNISICVDSKGREVVAFGKGIGFVKPPYEIPLDRINRTFYNIKDFDYGTLREVSTKIINVAIYIVDMASEDLNAVYNSSVALALADHISFALKRNHENIVIDMPIVEDMNLLYPDEVKEAKKALQIINEQLSCDLPESEIPTLALHFINDREPKENEVRFNSSEVVNACIIIIEEHFQMKINRESFNCSRFITHLDYLIRRGLNKKQIDSQNIELFSSLTKTYANTYQCANKIANLLKVKLNISLSDEEILYLVLHINRLCARAEN